jgi:glycosyltransferase involved in cell wall biosynthesis
VEPRDVVELADAIAKLAHDRNLIRSMGQKGRERLEKNFTMEQMARKNEDFYYCLVQSIDN